jgi:predicted nucleic acid-binding protein
MGASPNRIVVEASPLISCLKIDRLDLLEVFACPLLCLNHVRGEVTYFGQDEKLTAALEAKRLEEVELTDLGHIVSYDSLRSLRPALGPGECASIIYAHAHEIPLIITDKVAKNEAKRRGVLCVTTEEMVVLNIRHDKLTVPEADELIAAWRAVGEGVTRVKSFAELLK